MATVTIDSGPVVATDSLRKVPRDQWPELVRARRDFCEIKLKYDCRCVAQFVKEADDLWQELDYKSADDLIQNGYKLDPEEIRIVAEWLELNAPEEAVSLSNVQRLIADPPLLMTAEEAGKKGGRGKKRSSKLLGLSWSSNDPGRLAARIKRDYPNIAKRAEAGEFRSIRAAAIEAGIITPPTPFQQIEKLIKKHKNGLTRTERKQLRDLL